MGRPYFALGIRHLPSGLATKECDSCFQHIREYFGTHLVRATHDRFVISTALNFKHRTSPYGPVLPTCQNAFPDNILQDLGHVPFETPACTICKA